MRYLNKIPFFQLNKNIRLWILPHLLISGQTIHKIYHQMNVYPIFFIIIAVMIQLHLWQHQLYLQ